MKLVHLQGIGDVVGTPVEALIPGDRVMFNYGIVSVVHSIEQTGLKTLLVTWRAKDGKLYPQRKRLGTMVVLLDKHGF